MVDHQYEIGIDVLKVYLSAFPTEVRLQAKSLAALRNQVKRIRSTDGMFGGAEMMLGLLQLGPFVAEDTVVGGEVLDDESPVGIS